jgi:hypothetical protein
MSSPKRFDLPTFTARFGCGFLVGGLGSGFAFSKSFAVAFLIGGLTVGMLAWLLGDDFWKNFKNWMWWL